MDRGTLRSVQRPLKQLYREQPETGLIVLEASGTLGEEGLCCSVHTVLYPSTGGDGTLVCSGDMSCRPWWRVLGSSWMR